MVAFLLGPIEDVLQTWRPPLDRFSTRVPARRPHSPDESESAGVQLHDDEIAVECEIKPATDSSLVDMDQEGSCSRSTPGEERNTLMHWEWVNKGYKELWWQDKLLFSRRTTIWEGKIRQVETLETANYDADAGQRDLSLKKQDTLDCFIKATYLPPGLAEHEHEMIGCLDPDKPLPENSKFVKLDDEIKAQVYQNLPKSLGLVDFGGSGSPTTNVLPANAPTDGRAPNLTHLELVALVIQGPIGNTLDPRHDGLTLADVCEIYQGPFLQLWYGAERGVHFRDVSPGNILWKVSPDGRKVGFLIDYGNARFENERRDKSIAADSLEGLCEDDLRSGTQHFLCVSVLEAATVVPDYRAFTETLSQKTLTDTMRTTTEADLYEAVQKLLINRHRYIDDVQSLLYNLLSHVRPYFHSPSSHTC